jgi:hypothetical protein
MPCCIDPSVGDKHVLCRLLLHTGLAAGSHPQPDQRGFRPPSGLGRVAIAGAPAGDRQMGGRR